MTAVPARITWAVTVIDPRPQDRLLEAGCGPGVAAALLCARLTTGSMLAVDRSPAAVRRAAERNAGHIAAGRLGVREGSLAELAVAPESFDVAFTIDVNVFWTRPAGPEAGVLAAALRPGGRLLVLYGADGPTGAERVTGPVTAALSAAGFAHVRVVTGDGGFGVTARKPAEG